MDALGVTLQESKKKLTSQRVEFIRAEAVSKVAEVQKKAETSTEAAQSLAFWRRVDGVLAADEMQSACEKAGTTLSEALEACKSARNHLLQRQKELRSNNEGADVVKEIGTLLEQLTTVTVTLDKQRAQMKDHEDKFMSEKLIQEVTALLDKLDEQVASVKSVAAPFCSNDFSETVYVPNVVDAMKKYMLAESKTAKNIWEAILQDGKATEEKFQTFTKTLPQLVDGGEPVFTDRQLKSAFIHFAGKDVELTE